MILSEMITLVRRELKDESSNLWSDDELTRHIDRAVAELSEAIPREQKATIATTADSREVDISSLTDRVMVEAVEYPVDESPKRYQRFVLWADTLTLLGSEVPDGSDCYVYYGKLHTLDAVTSTILAKHEELVAAGAAGYAAIAWGVYAVNRVNVGGVATPREYRIWGKERLCFFSQEVKRLGRGSRVRTRSLYKPCYPPVSKTTDCGP